MNNKYFEYGVAPKNESKEKSLMMIFKIIKYVFVLIDVLVGYFAFMFINLLWVAFAISLTITLILNYFQNRFYNFYDLVFVDGRIAVSKIVNNKRRKYLVKFECKSIEKIGFLGGETYEKYLKDKEVKNVYVTDDLTSNDVCFLINTINKKTLLLLPYNEYFLVQVLKYCGNNKLEKTFIEKFKV